MNIRLGKLVTRLRIPHINNQSTLRILSNMRLVHTHLNSFPPQNNITQTLLNKFKKGAKGHCHYLTTTNLSERAHHYNESYKADLLAFKNQAAKNLVFKNALIVADSNHEETACSTLEQILSGKITKQKFSGSIVSLTYIKSENAPNLGFIVLNLNSGKICEQKISHILEEFNCIGVFSDTLDKKNDSSQYPLSLQKFVARMLVANITSYYNNDYTSTPKFSTGYYSILPTTIPIEKSLKNEAVIDSLSKPWDIFEFSNRVHTPVTIGRVNDPDSFTKTVPRCIHLPIKLPGSDIRIPKEYKHFSNIFQSILNFEVSINPKNWNNTYAYFTVDQGFVPASKIQRVPGPHVDGIPRDRDNPGKQFPDHAYLVTNAIPTMFYAQKFNMTPDMKPYDLKKHDFFAIFRALSDESRTITSKPYEIVLMNSYSVHTPTQARNDVHRTFVRLEISTLEFDRLGNSENPYFKGFPGYPFKYIPRPKPPNLTLPTSVYLNKPITNMDYTHEALDHFGRANLHAIFTENEKVKRKDSRYKNLELIAKDIMNPSVQGTIVIHDGIPHTFCLYEIEDKKVKLNSIFTLKDGNGQETLIYIMKILKEFSDTLSIQAGLKENSTPISIVINENNSDMQDHFLRAARYAKVEVAIEKDSSTHTSVFKPRS